METVVVNNLDSNAFWRNSHEVDVIANGIPIEVKYQNRIIDKDFNGIREFMRKFSVKKGVLITKNEEKTVKSMEGDINLVSAVRFVYEHKS